MPRPASDYTEAIRSLLDETGGSITHGDARPRLEKLGFEIAKKPKPKSEALSAVEEYDYDKKALDAALREGDKKTVAAILDPVWVATGLDDAAQKAVVTEMKVRLAFYDERNNFDVTKYNWSQTDKSRKPSTSRKPADSKNQRARAATTKKAGDQPKPKHRRRKRSRVANPSPSPVTASNTSATIEPTADELAALELIEKLGGVGNAETRINELRGEATQLQQAVELVAQLTKRSDELQKRLKSAA